MQNHKESFLKYVYSVLTHLFTSVALAGKFQLMISVTGKHKSQHAPTVSALHFSQQGRPSEVLPGGLATGLL